MARTAAIKAVIVSLILAINWYAYGQMPLDGTIASASYTFTPTFANGQTRDSNSKLSEVVSVNDFQGVDTTTKFQNAIAYGAGTIRVPAGVYFIHNLTMHSNQRIVGDGINSTIVRFLDNSGILFDYTGISFAYLDNMSISAGTASFKTSGSTIGGLNGGQMNHFTNLRIADGFRGIELGTSGTTWIENTQFVSGQATPWDFFIGLTGNTVSTWIETSYGVTNQGCITACMYIAGTLVDTVKLQNVAYSNGSTTVTGPPLLITHGEWILGNNLWFETNLVQDGLQITGGQGIRFNNVHTFGLHAATISGGTAIGFSNSYFINSRTGGLNLTGGSDIQITNSIVSDSSNQGTGTFNGIDLNGSTDVQLSNIEVGRQLVLAGAVSTPKYCVSVNGSDKFWITNLHCKLATTASYIEVSSPATRKVEIDGVITP